MRQTCIAFKLTGDEPGMVIPDALPDVRDWDYAGQEDLNGVAAHVWAYTARHEGKEVVYRFHSTADARGTPLRLAMRGDDLLSGAHFDEASVCPCGLEYVADYDPDSFVPGEPDPALFDAPQLCQGVVPQDPDAGPHRRSGALRMASVVPTIRRAGAGGWTRFRGARGRPTRRGSGSPAGRYMCCPASQTLDPQEYQLRARLFESNAALIAAHNAANKSYQMTMNKFGDWTNEEFLAVMLPRHGRPAPLEASEGEGQDRHRHHDKHTLKRNELPWQNLTDPSRLPRSISWQGTGADGIGVKDQAACGSCWAFGAAGAMEGAWFVATGQRVSFSEQQILDCSWGYDPERPIATHSCDGGDQYAGIGHVVDAGGIALTDDYDIDAAQESFRFYSSGVYFEPQCHWKDYQLDHAVMLVGYGTEQGGDYWLIKNRWGKGSQGGKIGPSKRGGGWATNGALCNVARDNHGCGVPTDAFVAVVDTEALSAS
eukprot:scaffold12.g8274.t1